MFGDLNITQEDVGVKDEESTLLAELPNIGAPFLNKESVYQAVL
jgi:hypothetical protein